MKKAIPGGITPEHFMEIRRYLLTILEQLTPRPAPSDLTDKGALEVNMRLNDTDAGETSSPVFAGWVENDISVAQREQENDADPGLYRFGDENWSVIYDETLRAGRGVFKERDWHRQFGEKTSGAKGTAKKRGVNYQKFIGIIVPDPTDNSPTRSRCVGTLVTGYSERPTGGTQAHIESIMRHWAVNSDSPLVKYLQNNFRLSGPTFS